MCRSLPSAPNTATCAGESFYGDQCRAIDFYEAPVVDVEKDPPTQGPVLKGSQVTWIISYNNNGADTLYNAVLVDTLPLGFTIVSTTPNYTSLSGGGGTPQILTWNLGDVPASSGGSIEITVQTPNSVSGTQLFTNLVDLSGEDKNGLGGYSDSDTADVSRDRAAPGCDQEC